MVHTEVLFSKRKSRREEIPNFCHHPVRRLHLAKARHRPIHSEQQIHQSQRSHHVLAHHLRALQTDGRWIAEREYRLHWKIHRYRFGCQGWVVFKARESECGTAHHWYAHAQAGVRSFIITFDVYVILNVLRNMIIKDLTPMCLKSNCKTENNTSVKSDNKRPDRCVPQSRSFMDRFMNQMRKK